MAMAPRHRRVCLLRTRLPRRAHSDDPAHPLRSPAAGDARATVSNLTLERTSGGGCGSGRCSHCCRRLRGVRSGGGGGGSGSGGGSGGGTLHRHALPCSPNAATPAPS
eukprot:138014-Chlamydomonas_euryale.AAC.8